MFAKQIYSWLESEYLVKKMSWNDDPANAEILFGDGKNTDNICVLLLPWEVFVGLLKCVICRNVKARSIVALSCTAFYG